VNSIRAYRTLLRLFPGDYRYIFEAEMLEAFARAVAERRASGWFKCARFVWAELAGLALHAPLEWIAKATTSDSVRARSLPDLRMMRPAGVARSVWFQDLRPPETDAQDEIAEAQRRVSFCLRRMEHAIANHDFQGARYYSNEDLKARESLRELKTKYGLAE
jgi:hypothetical protein